MIVASFLTKDLLIDWRYGENFFMKHLVDGDPASNNGGWQWAASTGTDSQPFFRIFNPKNQAQRWDPEGRYIRQWLPELRNVPDSHIHDSPASSPQASDYPEPMVDHAARRAQALELYRNVRTKSVEGASQ
jgi:deoxyribodipyrimidine photo-lyase